MAVLNENGNIFLYEKKSKMLQILNIFCFVEIVMHLNPNMNPYKCK